jgi:hypothetical protein
MTMTMTVTSNHQVQRTEEEGLGDAGLLLHHAHPQPGAGGAVGDGGGPPDLQPLLRAVFVTGEDIQLYDMSVGK